MDREKVNVGIEFNNEFACLAYIKDGKPTIQKTDRLTDTMPSVVGFNKKGGELVGGDASSKLQIDRRQRMKSSNNTQQTNVFSKFKRTMGTEKTYYSPNADQIFSSEELLAKILRKLKSFKTDEDIKAAVVTVPAKFDIQQKDATQRAAKLAGLEQCELLQEPIAASMAYGLDAQNKSGFWVVFDFGGGSFDTALVKVEEGIMKVIDTEGDNWLGGKNLDNAVVDEVIIPYLQENFSIDSILEDENRKETLRDILKSYAEDAKNQLSFQDSYDIVSDMDDIPGEDDEGEKFELEITLTREGLKEVISPIFQRAIDMTKTLIERNNLSTSSLSALIPVGGPTRSPILQDMLKDQLIVPESGTDPMTAIATGAALYATTVDLEKSTVVNPKRIQLDISNEATSVETEDMVPIQVLPDKTEGELPEKLYAEFSRGDGAWSSGRVEINDTGEVIEVKLEENEPNQFEVSLYDEKGDKLACEPDQFTITQESKGRESIPKPSQTMMLPKSTLIDEKYSVQFIIKKGLHAETYRVKDQKGNNYFLKLFQGDLLNAAQSDSDNHLREGKILKNLHHPNITQYVDDGICSFDDQQFAYLILDFISGETLKERIRREYELSRPAVKYIIIGVLNGVRYLHSQASPVVHNALSIDNVMLDLISKDPVPKIIDFHHASKPSDDIDFQNYKTFNPFYLAPECFEGSSSTQSDLFAVGALMYHLLFGLPPWFVDLSDYNNDPDTIRHVVLEARQKPLRKPVLSESTEAEDTAYALKIIEKAMKADPDERFGSADEMISAIYQDEKSQSAGKANKRKESLIPSKSITDDGNQQKGFSQIAGMDDLKDTLYNNVIRALSEKELFEQYGLTIPNGMLLYGPPGCGKSFIAEKLAEEAGYNYKEVKPSTIASIYVHGTQEKIGQLFDEARKNAPTILNFEEFDALVPKRDSHAGGHQAGEVNEFLTQLNNCGQAGVFVIATTNQPMLIDEAVLRAGRIDKLFYVPPPDFEARRAMLSLLLDERPVDSEVDYALTAQQTANFVAIDLQHIVDEAAREALKAHDRIDQETLAKAIEDTKPSVSRSQLDKYEKTRAEIEADNGSSGPSKGRIGF